VDAQAIGNRVAAAFASVRLADDDLFARLGT